MENDNRYKIFRNFMTNELGITKDDIVDWAQQATEAIVERMMAAGKLNVQAALDRAVDRAVRSALQLDSEFHRHKLEEKILEQAARKLEVRIK